ncbi:MAG: hypothetical protein LBK52_03710 [Deltaproteobacteria bacterium]|jgi:hypothetical protein|nr:hypothetical protein [Deltaproteobacteria bacterium]
MTNAADFKTGIDKTEIFDPILRKFVKGYFDKPEGVGLAEWLAAELQAELPEHKKSAVTEMADEIIGTLTTIQAYKKSLSEAINSGRSKESWFAGQLKDFTSNLSPEESAKYIKNIYISLKKAHSDLLSYLTAQNDPSNVEYVRISSLQANIHSVERLLAESQADFESWDWNSYQATDITADMGQKAAEAALLGAAVGVGSEDFRQIWTGEDVKYEGQVENALNKESDIGLKAAVAGAVKAASEKNLLPEIPQGTSASVIATVVHSGIEKAHIYAQIGQKKITPLEGLEKIENDAVATAAAVVTTAAEKTGGAIGLRAGVFIGSIFGPAGAAIGGAIGYKVGSLVGKAVGEIIVETGRKVVNTVVSAVKSVGSAILKGAAKVGGAIKGFFSSIFS